MAARAASRAAKELGGASSMVGDDDSGRAKSFELSGEVGGLVAGAGNEDADVGQGWHLL